ncbi:MAG: RNB domain-containing ribonuclease, partial [Sphingomonadales bacterium]|nr:RNB domain-containing ribonuclease [Sphingomonadales bacterium]
RMKEHKAREPLELDLPERKVTVDDEGNITSIVTRDRFDAHRLIEEFMIAANVAAAEALEKKHMACMYRVHEEPAMDKMEALRDFMSSLDIDIAKGQVLSPRIFNGVLSRVADTPYKGLVNDVVLRSQMQAYYSPENRGHFGLALARYGHFTSPIRRYADLVVHRGLIRAYGLGGDGLTDQEIEDMVRIAEDISGTERRAMAAERESTDRYLAAFLSEQVGEVFTGRISGVQRFGLFISVEPSGADAFVPISTLGYDYFDHDEVHHTLTGQRSGLRYQLGDTLEVKLKEADKVSGSLIVEVLSGGQTVKPTRRGKTQGHRPRPGTEQKKRGKGGRKKGGKAKGSKRR